MESTILAALDKLKAQIFLIIALLALAMTSMVFMISRSIYRPLDHFAHRISNISDTKDLTARLDYKRQDEISMVASAFNQMIGNLQEAISHVHNASGQLAQAADEMSNISSEVSNATDAQSDQVEQAAVAMHEMTSTIQDIARNASNAADSVNLVHERIQEGVKISEEARLEIEALTNEVDQAVDAIKQLEQNSESIGLVLDAIQGVAEQTNLLALNAAIEAARAGEQGRGFAVVADEVRTLAQRTQESTESIRETINQLQSGTAQVVSTVDKSSQRAAAGIAKVNKSADVLQEIAEQMSAVADMNIQIATAAEQQSATAEEINRNIVSVSELAKTVATQCSQSSCASDELSNLGATLKASVSAFKAK
jgi:methyl-accepting chemotaxis protein